MAVFNVFPHLMLIWAMLNKKFERNVNSNRNRTDKINSISDNSTKIMVSFDFYRFSYVSHPKLGCACSHEFQKKTGMLLLERIRWLFLGGAFSLVAIIFHIVFYDALIYTLRLFLNFFDPAG